MQPYPPARGQGKSKESEPASVRSQAAKESQRTYAAEPCLSAPALAAWEAANNVVLPEAYRLFLLEIGNGGMMPGAYCDFKLWPLDPRSVDSHLREPFLIARDRFEQRMAHLRAEERGDDPLLFPELSASWEEGWPPGCVRLGHYPSYDSVYLIVSGDLYGMVWCGVDGGIPELDRHSQPLDFLGWFEATLLDLQEARGAMQTLRQRVMPSPPGWRSDVWPLPSGAEVFWR